MKTIIKIILLFLLSFAFFSCSKDESYFNDNESLIEEVSPIFIPRKSEITIVFTKATEGNPEEAFSFSPKIKGKWNVSDDKKTFVFVPNKVHKQNASFTLTCDYEKLYNGKESGKFAHPFIADRGWYKINFDEIELDENTNLFSLKGTFITDIPVSYNKVKKVLKTIYSEGSPKITWNNKNVESDSFEFIISDIKSPKKNNNLEIIWKGKSIGFSKKNDKDFCGSKIYKIPADNVLDVIDINTSKKNVIQISFSKILDKSQNLMGYMKAYTKSGDKIQIENTSIRNNILTVYSDTNFKDLGSFVILEGIKSIDGFCLGTTSNIALDGTWEIPQVNFANSGVILPTSQGSKIIVKTKNLTGLLVQIYAIPNRTMYQFLQENELNEKDNLYRVGKPIYEKHVNLNWEDHMQNKNIVHGIDISEIVKKHKYGMYHVRISYRLKDIKYVCNRNHKDFSHLKFPNDEIEKYKKNSENSYWDYFSDLNYEDRSTYYQYNDDPCHPSFYLESYNTKIITKQNIIISDIALSAKKDNSGKLYITASNLKDAQPLKNTLITLYSFIGEKIVEAKTDNNGIAVFEYTDDVHYITGSNNEQITYLKLSSENELSVSHFEIGGVDSKDGVKGFIYGERGIWRPGDTMHLTFVLQDLEKNLPDNIPVNFELIDPLGITVDKKVLKDHVDEFYPFETSTSLNGTTGLYLAKITIGGNTWTKSLKVESIVPNKLNVKLTSNADYLVVGDNKLKLEGSWLHGASAAGYKSDVSVSYSNANNNFKFSDDFVFTNPLVNVSNKNEKIYSGYLNNSSYIEFQAFLNLYLKAPGFLNANFVSRIYEPSGAFSTEYTSMKFSPFDRYIGIKLPKGDASRNMLLTDKKHEVDVVCFNADGTPVKSANLSYKILKINWKWWWEKDAYTNAGYVESEHYETVSEGHCEIQNGKSSFNFEVKYPSWGRYIVMVSDGNKGHSAGKITYIDWPNWAGRSTQGTSGSSTMIALNADKKTYKSKDTVSISFPSTKGASAFVTIEKNGKILKEEWIGTSNETTEYKFNVTPEMSPNVYVHVSIVQPHLQTANSLPVRLYGVIPVLIENPDTILNPLITCSQEFEPGKETVISVSEKNGKEMTYTLAVVDEGLLGLTSFKAENPHNEFYGKEASQIKSWDVYSYVINAYTGNLETLLTIGGSDDITEKNNAKKINRFAPVVKYFGPFKLQKGEKKATTFEMPQYIGAVRVILIAGTKGAYGVAEKTVPVKSDLMVLCSLPKTIGSNEIIEVPVTIFNGTSKKRNISVDFSCKGNVNVQSKKDILLNANSDGIVYFPIETSSAENAELTIKATGKDIKTAVYSCDISINSRGSSFTYTKNFTVNSKSTGKADVESPFEEGTKKLSLSVSAIKQINLKNRLDYLITYPHGCIEQITSGAFPQLYLSDFINLSKEQIIKTQDNVSSVIKRYTQYQLSNGAFAYWPGNSQPSEWGTCYALHFMTLAKQKGYNVPEEIYSGALNYVYNKSISWINKQEQEELESYRLFVLALAGKTDLGTMNRLSELSELNNSSLVLLSSAYSISGNKKKGETLLKKINSLASFFRSTGGIFESSKREDCFKLLAAVYLENSMLSSRYSKIVTENLTSKEWMNTQEIAFSLLSLFASYKTDIKEEKTFTTIVDNSETKVSFDKTFSITELIPSNRDVQLVSVKNDFNKTLYATLTSTGNLKPGKETETSNGIKLVVSYFNEDNIYINPTDIKHGDNFSIQIAVHNKTDKKIENIALTLPIPTGWEVSNDRIGNGDTTNNSYSYMDIKDDKILVYFDLPSEKVVTFDFKVTSAYLGAYWIPAITAEAMYDNSINALVKGHYVDTRKK